MPSDLKIGHGVVRRPHSKSLGRHASTWWTAADPKKEKPRDRKVAGPVPFCWRSLADYLGLSDFLWRPSGLTKSGLTKMSCPGISETYPTIGSKGGPGGSGRIVVDMLAGDTKRFLYGLRAALACRPTTYNGAAQGARSNDLHHPHCATCYQYRDVSH